MSLTGGWARWSGGPVLVGLIVLAGLTAGACTSSSDVVDDELTGGSASRDDAPLSGPVRDNPVTADSLPVVSESLPVISDYGAYTIDLENGAVTSVLIDDDPDLNLSPDGTRIAYMGRDGLFMADSDGSNEVKLAEERIPKVIYWFPDSSGFVYSNDESTSIFDAEKREIVQVADERAFNIGRTYYAWSTDGQEVIYATSDGLFSASRDGFIRASLVDLNESTYVTINRRVGATHLYLERPSGAVIVEISGRNERILTRDRYPHMDWVSWSLDGTRVIYSGVDFQSGVDGTFIADVDGNEPVSVSNARLSYSCYPWSRDGVHVAAQMRDGLLVARSDGSDSRILTTHSGGCPQWSPDDTRISYRIAAASAGVDRGVYVADVYSRSIVRISDYSFPSWSPDGAQMVYRNTSSEYFLADGDGMNPERLSIPSDGFWLRWSADSRFIAYLNDDGLWVVDVSDDSTQQVSKYSNLNYVWSKDGKRIAYSALGELDYGSPDAPTLPSIVGGIYVVDADGQNHRQYAEIRDVDKLWVLRHPGAVSWLPDGTGLTFRMLRYAGLV